MVKFQTYRAKRREPNFEKCAFVAAILSAAIVITVEMIGSPVTPAKAGLSTPSAAPAEQVPATVPATTPR